MDFFDDQRNLFSFVSFILALILDANESAAVTRYALDDNCSQINQSETLQYM